MGRKKRRHFSVEQKAAVVRRHLKDKVPVSDLCDEYQLQPSVYYGWQQQVLDNLAAALEPTGSKQAARREKKLSEQNAALRDRLAQKDGVIAEVAEEMVKLKKALGEP